jgi:hypothetical protein
MGKRDQELATSSPDLAALREEYLYAIERRDRSIFARQRLNYQARYCVWPNESPDGKRRWMSFPASGASVRRA